MFRSPKSSHARRSRRLEIEQLEDRVVPAVTRVTFSPATDFFPAWDPRGETIAFVTNRAPGSGSINNLGLVQANATNEYLAARGPTTDFGIAWSPSWVGSTGLVMLNERVVFHEYMTFNSAAAPFPTTFVRTLGDGNDAAFTRKLLVDGGGGGENIVVSRDGTRALWRFSDSGGVGTIQIRTALVSSLVGGSARTSGTFLQSIFSSTQAFYGDSQGFALSPDGSQYVIAEPFAFGAGFGFDLFIHSTSTGAVIRRLTTTGQSSGVLNVMPEFSPDGTKIAFASNVAAVSGPNDLYLINVDGTGLRNLTSTPTISENMPTWSPTGNRLAFASPSTNELGISVLPGEVNNWNIYVMDVNQPPTANPGGPYFVPEGGSISLNGAASSDPDGAIATYQWDLNYTAPTFDVDATGPTPTFNAAALDGPATRNIALRVIDNAGATSSVVTMVTINNVLPSGAADHASVSVNEGDPASNTGTFGDPGDPVALSASVGTVSDAGGGHWSWAWPTSDGPDNSQTVTIFGNDGDGAGAVPIASFSLVVNNVLPSGAADHASVSVNEGDAASNTGTFGDPGDPVALSASVGAVSDTGGGHWSWAWPTSDGPDNSQTVTIYGNDGDGDGAVPIATFSLVVNNVLPSGSADHASVTVNEGDAASNTGTFGDPGDPVALSASVGTVSDTGGGHWSWSWPTSDGPDNSQTVTIFGNDGDGAGAVPIASFSLVVNNVLPSGAADHASVTVNEGDAASNTGTFGDPGDPVALSASVGTVSDTGGGHWSWSVNTTGMASQAVTIYGDDGAGAVPIASFSLVVNQSQSLVLTMGPSQVNLNGSGVVPITILSTPGFQATSLDLTTVTLAGGRPTHLALTDVDHDGDLDLVMQFRRQDFVDEYSEALLDDLADGTLDNNHQSVTLAFAARTTTGADILGAALADLFMTGKKLETLLDSLGY